MASILQYWRCSPMHSVKRLKGTAPCHLVKTFLAVETIVQ
ncbi:hypothetical protein DUNSADRAFT_15305 [Dunaliella salina]|uniref:Encoded protein n=1 Tax=Dunaliella salina TaxID=3046 RepID=A0ABQ7G5P0_DUNSA|nr:hypothetical protein DUNSADRAFT_15305 [Dunaliella salina]|eukprot:KAF5829925.1 hypothetical protein DUNSADRAFT_15305 [Dunaliella salina]